MLALYWLLPQALGGKTPPPLWRFLTFTQNIELQPGTAFSHAWSLCIEEQFYLVLPAALMLIAALRQHRRVLAWALILVLTVAAISWRDHLWTLYGTEASGALAKYYPNVYYGSLCRLDEFLPGVAVALLRNGHPAAWAALMAQPRRLLAVGVVACSVMFWMLLDRYYIDGYGYGRAMSTFGYSAMAWAFGLMVMASLAPRGKLSTWRVPGAEPLARWSYAIYLTHKPIAFVLVKPLAAVGIAAKSGGAVPVIALACLAGGWLLYRLVELPFLRLRDRWLPSHFRTREVGVLSGAFHAPQG
ncbi:MAG: acyltransferase [Sphingomonadales bacterium]|nr:MAG: acyltransferase [Sphingomonadales bacterium]